MLINEILNEGSPRRSYDHTVEAWIDAVMARPDANQLYLHGSNHLFERFADPKNPKAGTLLHFTKLTGENRLPGTILQAEYYGKYLYLVKLHYHKPFRPYVDPVAKDIMKTALIGVWDYDEKIKWGRLDYQDQHLVVPIAVTAGYDFFRIYEVSIQGDSCGVPRGDMVEIVDRLN